MTPTACPTCGGPWWPTDVRGVLTFQHAPNACPHDHHEAQTQAADDDRAATLARSRFTRRATDTERALLAHLGYTPTPGTPNPTDNNPGTLVDIRWIGGIRRRTFPNLPAPPDLPNPNAPWPTPPPATPLPTPPTTWPDAW